MSVLKRFRKPPELVPQEELPRCEFCGRRIPTGKHAKRGRRTIHRFCSPRCYGLWRTGRPQRKRIDRS